MRNSTIDNQNQREKIKTSQEIEQELFERFPTLRNNYVPIMNNDKKNN